MSRFHTIPNSSLGCTLRAFRLGYRWARGAYFMRLSDDGGNRFRIDLAPPDDVPKHKTRSEMHICWWDNDEQGYQTISQIPCLRHVTAVHKPISFCINHEGEYAGL